MLAVLLRRQSSALLPISSIRIHSFHLHPSNLTSRPSTALDKAYRRCGSTDASSRRYSPRTLLPDPVSGWPTPWITAEDFERYMCVLYDSGWGIRFSSAHSKPTKSHPSRVVPELLKTYHFANVEFAAKFAEDLKELMTAENVRPCTKILYELTKPTSHSLIFIQHHCVLHVENTQLTIYTHTHSARPALASKNAPGITLRDVRFAMLADLLNSNGSIAKDAGDASSTILTWDGYQRSDHTF